MSIIRSIAANNPRCTPRLGGCSGAKEIKMSFTKALKKYLALVKAYNEAAKAFNSAMAEMECSSVPACFEQADALLVSARKQAGDAAEDAAFETTCSARFNVTILVKKEITSVQETILGFGGKYYSENSSFVADIPAKNVYNFVYSNGSTMGWDEQIYRVEPIEDGIGDIPENEQAASKAEADRRFAERQAAFKDQEGMQYL